MTQKENYQLQFEKAYLGHNAAIYDLSSTPDGSGFYSGAGDGWIAAWKMGQPDGQLIAETGSPVLAVRWTEPLNRLVAGTMDGRLHFIDLHGDAEPRVFDLGGKAAVFSLLYTAGKLWVGDGTGRLSVWNAALENEAAHQITNKPIRCLIPDGEKGLLAGCSDSMIYRINGDDGAVLDAWVAHDPSVFAMAADPDGQRFWSGGRDATIRSWHFSREKQPAPIEIAAHWYTVNDIAFHPTKRIFATASRDKRLRLWDGDGQLLQSIDPGAPDAHVNSINTLWWTPDGQSLFSAGDDRSIRQWTLKT